MDAWLEEHIWRAVSHQSTAAPLPLPNAWQEFLRMNPVLKSKVQSILDFVKESRETCTIYPKQGDIFRWAKLCNPDNIKVIILGQDPYHGQDQATGLAFSVPEGGDIPPSLRNIFGEVGRSFNCDLTDATGSLKNWAEQGVLLLNSVLTVERGQPASHNKLGWQTFTDHVIKTLSDRLESRVFLLWGSNAAKKGRLINEKRHLVLRARHPSPLAALSSSEFLPPFLGCGHFEKANNYLIQHSIAPINWIDL